MSIYNEPNGTSKLLTYMLDNLTGECFSLSFLRLVTYIIQNISDLSTYIFGDKNNIENSYMKSIFFKQI